MYEITYETLYVPLQPLIMQMDGENTLFCVQFGCLVQKGL